jgi:hypothetical protein
LVNNKELFYEYLDSNQVKTRIVWILNNAIYKAIEEKDEETFKQALKALMTRKTPYNSTYPKVAVQWLNQALCFYQSSCLVDSECSEIATFG